MYFFTSLPNLKDRCSTAKKILLCHSAYFGSQRHNVAELQKAERIHIWWNYFIKAAERSAIPMSSLERLLYTCLWQKWKLITSWKGKNYVRIRIHKKPQHSLEYRTAALYLDTRFCHLAPGTFNMWSAQGKSSQERMVVTLLPFWAAQSHL